MTRHISMAGLELIKRFEGCRLDAYLCQAGVPTIGWGHTRGVLIGQTISEEQAGELLLEDLVDAERTVERLVKVPLTPNQHAALVSFTFNLGGGALARSTLLASLNAGDYGAVPTQILRFNKAAGKVERGLTNRRVAEAALWSK